MRIYEENQDLRKKLCELRLASPSARFEGLFRYTINGSIVRQRGCVLCGALGPTWCGSWPKTRAAEVWERDHREQHVIELVEKPS